jgi:hypothetical protein
MIANVRHVPNRVERMRAFSLDDRASTAQLANQDLHTPIVFFCTNLTTTTTTTTHLKKSYLKSIIGQTFAKIVAVHTQLIDTTTTVIGLH